MDWFVPSSSLWHVTWLEELHRPCKASQDLRSGPPSRDL